MLKRISVVTFRRLSAPPELVRPDGCDNLLERVQQTALMVKEHTERLSETCARECSELAESADAALSRLIKRLKTSETPIERYPDEYH